MQTPPAQYWPAPQLAQAQGLATQAPLTQLSHLPQITPVQASAGGQTRWQVCPTGQALVQGTTFSHAPPSQKEPAAQARPAQALR